MEILPIVLDKDFNMLGIIDDYSSLIWVMRYYTNGDFEITTSITTKNIDILQKDHFIVRDDDEHIGVIESKEIKLNEDGKEVLIVSGGFAPTLLARRIVAKQTQLSGSVSVGVDKLIKENAIYPSDKERKIPNFTIEETNFSSRLDAQYTGTNLLSTIEEICLAYHLGFKTYFNDNNFNFCLYEGIDRSYNQNVNPFVIFSDEYDNLLSSRYALVYSEQKTDILVAGEGEGINRKTLWVNNGMKTGLDRYESFVDRRDLSSNEGEIPNDQYIQQLREAGYENLTPFTGVFEGTVYFNNVGFREDVNVGDICVIENEKWGLYMNSRLIEVIESIDESGKYSLIPTFGI